MKNVHTAVISKKRYPDYRYAKNKFGAGVHVLWGIDADGKTHVASIRFDKDKFDRQSAIIWLKDHDYDHQWFVDAEEETKIGDYMEKGNVKIEEFGLEGRGINRYFKERPYRKKDFQMKKSSNEVEWDEYKVQNREKVDRSLNKFNKWAENNKEDIDSDRKLIERIQRLESLAKRLAMIVANDSAMENSQKEKEIGNLLENTAKLLDYPINGIYDKYLEQYRGEYSQKSGAELEPEHTENDDYFYYVNGDLGLGNDGWTKNKSKWITFTRVEAVRFVKTKRRPWGSKDRGGVFYGTSNNQTLKLSEYEEENTPESLDGLSAEPLEPISNSPVPEKPCSCTDSNESQDTKADIRPEDAELPGITDSQAVGGLSDVLPVPEPVNSEQGIMNNGKPEVIENVNNGKIPVGNPEDNMAYKIAVNTDNAFHDASLHQFANDYQYPENPSDSQVPIPDSPAPVEPEPENQLPPLPNTDDIMKSKTVGQPLKLTRTRILFGRLLYPFASLVYGEAGHGKTSLALAFAEDLSDNGPVLYMLADKGTIDTRLKEQLERLKIKKNISFYPSNDWAYFDEYLQKGNPTTGEQYKFVLIDNINDVININQKDWWVKREQHPDKSFIFIARMDKAGKKYMGDSALAYKADTNIIVENLVAKTVDKHRDGEVGKTMPILAQENKFKWQIAS